MYFSTSRITWASKVFPVPFPRRLSSGRKCRSPLRRRSSAFGTAAPSSRRLISDQLASRPAFPQSSVPVPRASESRTRPEAGGFTFARSRVNCRPILVVDANHIGPCDLVPCRSPPRAQSLSLACGGGGGGGSSPLPSCGRNVNGTPKMLTYSGWNSPCFRQLLVRRAPQSSPHHLLAQEAAT